MSSHESPPQDLSPVSKTPLEQELDRLQRKILGYERLCRQLCHDLAQPLMVAQAHAQELFSQTSSNRSEALTDALNECLRLFFLLQRNLQEQESMSQDAYFTKARVFSISDLIADAEMLFANRLREKSLSLEYKGEADFRFYLPKQAFQFSIFNNLLANAVAAAPPGSKITITTESKASQQLLRLRDHGPGLPVHILKELQEHLRSQAGDGKSLGFGLRSVLDWAGALDIAMQVQSFAQDQGGGVEFLLVINKN